MYIYIYIIIALAFVELPYRTIKTLSIKGFFFVETPIQPISF